MAGKVVTLRQAFGILAEVEWRYVEGFHSQLTDMGCNYPLFALQKAYARGWRPQVHVNAILSMNEDEITLTHPINYLNDHEAERYFA